MASARTSGHRRRTWWCPASTQISCAPVAGELRLVGFRDGLDPVGSWRSGASLRLGTAATAVMLSPPGAPGRGVQEDQRVSPTLEGGVAMPGGVGLGVLVGLPARPFVPLAAGDRYSRRAASWWGGSASIGASVPVPEPVRRRVREALFGMNLAPRPGARTRARGAWRKS